MIRRDFIAALLAMPMVSVPSIVNTGILDKSSITTGSYPVYIKVRRVIPDLITGDACGFQPMTGPTGTIFAMRPKYE